MVKINRLFRHITLCGGLLLGMTCSFTVAADDLKALKRNYRNVLLNPTDLSDTLFVDWIEFQKERDVDVKATFDVEAIEAYLAKQKEDGSWTDVDYNDKQRSAWSPSIHCSRIEELARLYYKGPKGFRHSKRIKAAVHKAMDYWFTTKPVCTNWWFNEIGAPKILGEAFVILEEQLSPSELEGAVEVLNHSRFKQTGQNKVWQAGNVLMRAMLQGDRELVRAARDTIASEIVLGHREGIKPDWSFHQHGPQQQFGNYGLSFVNIMASYYRIFKGTSYAFSPEQTNILTSLLDKGYRWVIWKRFMDVASLGRQLNPDAQFTKAYIALFAAADLGLSGFPKNTNTLVGHNHFDDSDYTIHRTKDWMASVKMASNRVIGTELINEDCPQGFYMGDGATYYYIDGTEYYDIFPFWDWRRIPGVTSFDDTAAVPKKNARNATDRVGGLSDGTQGMACMELNRDRLKAFKSWFFTDDCVVCLGTGIRSDSVLSVTTTVNQCLQKGNVELLNGDAWEKIEGKRDFARQDLRLWHDRIGYIVLDGKCTVETGERTGSWKEAMGTYSDAPVKGHIALIDIQHGEKPRNAEYEYIVLPTASKEKVSRFDVNSIQVFQNDQTAQIVGVKGTDEYWLSVYRPGTFRIEGASVNIDKAGVYHLRKADNGLQVLKSNPFRITK